MKKPLTSLESLLLIASHIPNQATRKDVEEWISGLTDWDRDNVSSLCAATIAMAEQATRERNILRGRERQQRLREARNARRRKAYAETVGESEG